MSRAAATDPAGATPVTLLTGFLGSGKTTLLNRLLAHPTMADTAILVNEIGEVGIDQALVRQVADDVVLLGAGCVCCTLRGDLVESLDDLRRRRARAEIPAFRRVVVETTGLADPGPIAHALLQAPSLVAAYRFAGIVTTVDGLLGARQLPTHPEAARQVAMADRLVLTKTDLAGAEAIAAVEAQVRRLNPVAPLLRAADHAALAPADVLDVAGGPADLAAAARRMAADRAGGGVAGARDGAEVPPAGGEADPAREGERHLARFSTFCLELDRPVPWGPFSEWLGLLLASRGDCVLRVKGILDVAGERGPVALHGVQHVFHAPQPLARWPWPDRRSRIVFVTLDLPRAAVERSLAEFLVEA